MSTPPVLDDAALQTRGKIPYLRWWIAALLMFATTINYLDRQTLSIAVTSKDLDIPEDRYAIIQTAFLVAYAVLQPFAGGLMDWMGTRWGFAMAVISWSLAEIGHTLATGVKSFASLRFLLGVGESGNYPGAIKAVSEWFPARERALATGLFNIGSGTGALIAAPIVGGIILAWGWQAAFLLTGVLGLLWVIAWLILYHPLEQHPRLRPEERAQILAGQERELGRAERVPLRMILAHKEIWALMLCKFLSDPVWYFYLFWVPKYLKTEHGFDLKSIALFAWVPYVFADFGCVLGGVVSSGLSRLGLPVLRVRKLAMCMSRVRVRGDW